MINEGKLIAGIKQGDTTDFKVLYERYSVKVHTVALRFGLDNEDANEIVQDVFVRLWLRRGQIDDSLSLNAYILTITKNLLIKRSRKLAYDTLYKHYLKENNKFLFSNTEDEIIYADLKEHTDRIIDELPCQQKEIFLLSKKENFSNKDISDKLGISIRTVENQIYRALKKLRIQLKTLDIISLLLLVSI